MFVLYAGIVPLPRSPAMYAYLDDWCPIEHTPSEIGTREAWRLVARQRGRVERGAHQAQERVDAAGGDLQRLDDPEIGALVLGERSIHRFLEHDLAAPRQVLHARRAVHRLTEVIDGVVRAHDVARAREETELQARQADQVGAAGVLSAKPLEGAQAGD